MTMATPVLTIAPGLNDRLEGSDLGVQFTFGVTRAGDSTVPVSVGFRVTSTQASANDFLDKELQVALDYPVGTLTMAAGETSKTISVVVSSDRFFEPDERFDIALFNPVDAVLGTQTTSSGIIRNDDPGDVLPVYRFAKISNGAYFFTGSLGERNQIIASFPDFRAEGVGFFAYAEASAGAPVYRFANLNNCGYFFTGSLAERDATIANYPNMRYEGSTFSVASSTAPGAQPVYRLANLTNGGYLYTTAAAERDAALSLGFWRNEGISFYAPTPSVVTDPSDASLAWTELAPESAMTATPDSLWV